MSEIHIFIIWEKAREKEAEILSDIKNIRKNHDHF